MLVYTSITKSYLPKARVLAKSLKHFHPDWTFVLLYSDELPSQFDITLEPFDEILTIEQLNIPRWKSWAFGHTVVELCTAVKGLAAKLLSQRPNVDKIMYLDPDIKVFNSLSTLESLLDQHDILLTPHLLDPEQNITAIKENEISALKHGIYNLGFFAAKTTDQGFDFICWWAERLRLFCRNDIPNGLFTDQRWCDLAPAFFSGLHIVRDKGCNVATWNIAHRPISKNQDGVFFVADVPLRFYHFTSYDNGNGLSMLKKYASSQVVVYQLWESYKDDLLTEGQNSPQYKDWFYGQFDNGESISNGARRIYQQRQYLHKKFPNPFSSVEPCYNSWWKKQVNLGNITSTGIPIQHNSNQVSRRIKKAIKIFKQSGLSGLFYVLRKRTQRK